MKEPIASIDAIRQDLADLALSPSVDQEATNEAATKLDQYLRLLARWNQTHNLTSIRSLPEMRIQHLNDCLAIIPSLRSRYPIHNATRILDVGSGGGLPGVILAILHPQWHVDCVEAVGKKAAFIREVAGTLALTNLSAKHTRVERLQGHPLYDLIISRAFSNLHPFVDLTRHLRKPEGTWAAMKGQVPDDEMNNLPTDIHVQEVKLIHVPGTTSKRCVIYLESKP